MIKNILKLAEFTNEFHKIKRIIYVNQTTELESDSEHTFQLAFFAWYLIEVDKLKLDPFLAMKYALVHDLVEIYAGDTFIYEKDQAYLNSKEEREKAARERIRKEYPEFEEMHKLIEEYENFENEEAKFIYALDKFIPVVNLFIDGGKMWREKEVTLEMIREAKDQKISKSKDIEKYWIEFVKILEENIQNLFFKN